MIVRGVIVEDGVEKARALWPSAVFHGFKPEIAVDVRHAARLIGEDPLPGIVILAAAADGGRGIALLRNVRAALRTRRVPIVLIGDDDSDTACVAALESGADDFVTRRTSTAELFARVKAILRARTSSERETVIDIDGLRVHPASRRIFTSRDGERTELHATRKEFDVLWFLLSHAGEVVARESILAGVCNHDPRLDTRTVDALVSRLRNMMRGTLSEGMIETIPRRGYRIHIDS
jgi:two-component system, OmpR family, phosphate regulon response regulator PhoB